MKAKYFPHDCNASRDPKIEQLEGELGLKGYAAYFKILEKFCENETYFLQKNYKILSKSLHVPSKLLQKVVENYNLFVVDNEKNIFFSESFFKRSNYINKRKSDVSKRYKNTERLNFSSNLHTQNAEKNENSVSENKNININKENIDCVNIKEKETISDDGGVLNSKNDEKMPPSVPPSALGTDASCVDTWQGQNEKRFNENLQTVLSDTEFRSFVISSYKEFAPEELKVIFIEFQVRNSSSSKYQKIYYDRDLRNELKNHLINFLNVKKSQKLRENASNENNAGIDDARIGENFESHYQDTL